ncbi:hypothetical protein PSEUDO8Z_60397 [Pseudomonas sp. 8Z]|nr:hypothetical protein PSEUDO8Z_60397 [Pseudomonas sp. 8Z]
MRVLLISMAGPCRGRRGGVEPGAGALIRGGGSVPEYPVALIEEETGEGANQRSGQVGLKDQPVAEPHAAFDGIQGAFVAPQAHAGHGGAFDETVAGFEGFQCEVRVAHGQAAEQPEAAGEQRASRYEGEVVEGADAGREAHAQPGAHFRAQQVDVGDPAPGCVRRDGQGGFELQLDRAGHPCRSFQSWARPM